MRRRLILTVLAVTAMVAVAFLLPLAAEVRTVAADRALAVADQEAQSLAGVLAADPSASALATVIDQLDADNRRIAVAFLPDGTRVGPQLAVPSTELALARQGRAFTTSGGGSTRVWVAVRLATGRVSVGVVSVPSGLLHQGVATAWVVMGLISLFVVLAGVVLADRIGRTTVRAIDALGAVTRRLRSGDLAARADPSGPEEIAAVGLAVNELAERITELLALEREAAADLSHGLRTPLAALRLEADSIRSPADRARIGRSVGEVAAAVDTLIRQVRRGRPVVVTETLDLAPIVRDRVAFWAALAEEEGRAWEADIPDGPVEVPVTEQEATSMVDAILGNVFSHTPEGTAFRVRLVEADGSAVLGVEDDGPGFPAGVTLERGRSGAGSTGLGLDIARKVAARTGGDLSVGPGSTGGALVEVRLSTGPPPGAPARVTR